MSDSFYFRVRGEVKGPFSREQIVSLIRKKRLGRHHELSTDAVIWTRAGEVEGLFESVAPAREEPEVGYAIAVPEADSKQDTSASQRSSSNSSSSEDEDDEWHYAKGRNTLGPVSSNELRAMLATGRLLGSDRVWNSSLADWLPAEDLPQFMGSVREDSHRPQAATAQRGGSGRGGNVGGSSSYFDLVFGLSSGTSLPDGSLHKYPSLTRYLQISEGINRIFFVLGLLGTAGWYIFMVAASGFSREGWMVAATIFVGFAGLLLSWLLLWFIFITAMAGLEFVRVFIKIEDNTSGSR
jgi:hypothetical protein